MGRTTLPEDGQDHRPTDARATQSIAPAADDELLQNLDRLVRETYQLWDEEWVGFSWRNYTYDHVRRVGALALSLADEEGADSRPLAVAAILHDVTKSYDGEVLMRDGQRVLDEQGLWRNAFLPPARANAVTRLYDTLGLAGSVHHDSGARIADALLAERGYPPAFRAHVGEIIVSHLKVTPASSPEGRCLYDADTIDANIGLPALYRNIQISLHMLERNLAGQGGTPSLDAYLTVHLPDKLREYVAERWPAWVGGKHRDFVGRLTTVAGRRRALTRIERLEAMLAEMQAELADVDVARETGYLALITYFMQRRRNPSLAAEVAVLEGRWPDGSSAARFVAALRRESDGEA